MEMAFNYIARTPDSRAKIAVQVAGEVLAGAEYQIDSIDTGWTSGRLRLENGHTVEVSLPKPGDNIFKVFVFDSAGGPIALKQDRIIIKRTAATVDAIPASHSLGVEVLEKLGGHPVLDYLVRSGDSLPKKGKKVFKAAESLKAGDSNSLNFKLWEGEITDPITDNRPIGVLKVSGSDFDHGVIPAGSDLECEYEILDSGNIVLEVSVPCIGGTFHSDGSFYSRQEGQIDFSSAADLVMEEGQRTLDRVDEIDEVVDDPKIEEARRKLESAVSLNEGELDTEKTQEGMEGILEARRILARIRKDHLKEIRQIDLNGVVSYFDEYVRKHARPSEASSFDNLVRTAQRSIDRGDKDFEYHCDELRGKNFEILWRQDWFVVGHFKSMVESPQRFADRAQFDKLSAEGVRCMESDDIDGLRKIVSGLAGIRISNDPDSEVFDVANIIRG